MNESDVGENTEILRILEEAGYEDVLVLDEQSASKVRTEGRQQLIQAIRDGEHRTISELAKQLDRHTSAVSRDLKLLYEYNVINYERDGKRKIPFLKHQTIFTKPVLLEASSSVSGFGMAASPETSMVGADVDAMGAEEADADGMADSDASEISGADAACAAATDSAPADIAAEVDFSGDIAPKATEEMIDEKTTIILPRETESAKTTVMGPGETSETFDREALETIISENSRYELIDIIGIGSFGAVLKVESEHGQLAVMKTYPGYGTEYSTRLLEAEIDTLSEIGVHDHIMSLVDSDLEPRPWLVEEYLPHGSLRENLPLEISSGVAIIRQLLDALAFAHEQDIAHGDLKPENILVDWNEERPEIRVIDWGAAVVSMRAPDSPTFFTEAYAPPELVDMVQEPADGPHSNRLMNQAQIDQSEYKLVDIYQIGKIAYETLTGLRGDSPLDDISSDNAGILPPSVVNQSLPSDIDQVILKALAREPQDRYLTVGKFRRAFGSVVREFDLDNLQALGEPSIGSVRTHSGALPAKTVRIEDCYLEFANRLAHRGYYTKAKRYYEAAIEREVDSAETHYDFAKFLADQGRPRQAKVQFLLALELAPKAVDIRNDLANTLVEFEEYERAMRHYVRALEFSEDRPDIHSNLALMLTIKGDYQRAEHHYQRALDLDPEQAEIHNNYGNLLTRMDRPEEAMEQFTRAILIDPDYAEAYHNLADINSELGLEEDADYFYRRAREINPDYTPGRYANVLVDTEPATGGSSASTMIA